MTRARRELVDLQTTPYYHCVCRCVRRAFLCGEDSYTGKSYEHRRKWVLDRLRTLQTVFAVDIYAYAIMSNHYHLVVRLSPEQAERWSEEEVAGRWQRLFSLPLLVARYLSGQAPSPEEHSEAQSLIATWRERLVDLSWFMRSLNEDLARRANAEDRCKGRFWEGRFKSQALLDEAAVLTCMTYVDLNPVRAGLAETPETSDFTSIQQRIAEYAEGPNAAGGAFEGTEKPRLASLESPSRDGHPNAFSFTAEDYLELVDWAGRAVRGNKRGAIASDLPPILRRLQLAPDHFVRHVQKGGRGYHVAALGQSARLREAAHRLGRRFLKGLSQSKKLYLREA